MAIQSMTGFVQITGAMDAVTWQWDARSVNGRGLDLRIRLPEGCETLEPLVRKEAAKWLRRGSVSLSLKILATEDAGEIRVNSGKLAAAVTAAVQVEAAAKSAGLATTPVTIDGLMAQSGVLEAKQKSSDAEPAWLARLRTQIPELFKGLASARTAEGAALVAVLGGQIDALEKLVASAQESAEARAASAGDLLRSRVQDLLEATDAVDEQRLAQELAIIAVKSDITEEIDRLRTHVAAARDLLNENGTMGRKFDFLVQELNREANTVCSKSGSTALTATGLEMKVLIDQMREQVQNLE